MKDWRPEGWDAGQIGNLDRDQSKTRTKLLSVVDMDTLRSYEDYQVEAGASAILKALKDKGAIMTPEQMKLLASDRKYPYGWLVFIPNEIKEQHVAVRLSEMRVPG